MRTIAFNNAVAGANTLSWDVDRDSVLTAITLTGSGAAVLSTESDLTVAAAATPSTSAVIIDLWRFILSNSAGIQQNWKNLAIPIEEGRTIFVCFTMVGACWLYLEEPELIQLISDT